MEEVAGTAAAWGLAPCHARCPCATAAFAPLHSPRCCVCCSGRARSRRRSPSPSHHQTTCRVLFKFAEDQGQNVRTLYVVSGWSKVRARPRSICAGRSVGWGRMRHRILSCISSLHGARLAAAAPCPLMQQRKHTRKPHPPPPPLVTDPPKAARRRRAARPRRAPGGGLRPGGLPRRAGAHHGDARPQVGWAYEAVAVEMEAAAAVSRRLRLGVGCLAGGAPGAGHECPSYSRSPHAILPSPATATHRSVMPNQPGDMAFVANEDYLQVWGPPLGPWTIRFIITSLSLLVQNLPFCLHAPAGAPQS
jgi:hypothetical protein